MTIIYQMTKKLHDRIGLKETSVFLFINTVFWAFLAFLVNGEKLTGTYFLALLCMMAGSVLVVCDTMVKHHSHEHLHTIVHMHGGTIHTHVITHAHGHDHYAVAGVHQHSHMAYMQSEEHRRAHQEGI